MWCTFVAPILGSDVWVDRRPSDGRRNFPCAWVWQPVPRELKQKGSKVSSFISIAALPVSYFSSIYPPADVIWVLFCSWGFFPFSLSSSFLWRSQIIMSSNLGTLFHYLLPTMMHVSPQIPELPTNGHKFQKKSKAAQRSPGMGAIHPTALWRETRI